MDKRLNTLGLAYRSKKVILGQDILDSMTKVKLILLASDISIKSRERIVKKSTYYNVEYIDEFSSEELSKALGKNNIKVIGITDDGFKKLLLNK